MSPVLFTQQKMFEHEHCTYEVSEYDMLLSEAIVDRDAPESGSSVDDKLRWLRSQIIGGFAEIQTPFGSRKLTYADHTASGRCLRYIEDYIIHNILPFYGNTHTCDNYVGIRTMKMLHEATGFVKKCLGGTQHDALLFCGSGTTAAIKRLQEVMGIAVPSILKEKVLNTCIGSEERWVVFVGPYEHHSNLLSWRQSLAEVIEIGLDEEGMIDIDDLKTRLEFYQGTGRPMLGSFSACSNVTGICSDTRSLARLLHGGPYVEIDMRSGAIDGYDAITLSPHKFLGGPGSPGILLMSKALYQLKYAPPSTCGGGTVNFVNSFGEQDTLYINDIEEREDAGTPQIIQRVKAALAFQVKEYIKCEVIAKREHDYIERALARLVKLSNIWVLGNTKAERQAILSFLIYTTTNSNKRDKPLNGAFVAKLLNDLFGIQARGGCACAGPYAHCLLGVDEPYSLAIKSAVQMGYNGAKLGWTRVSFPYYMSNEEYEFIVSAIEFLAVYGQRFLPLYHLNWKTGSWTLKTNTHVPKADFQQKVTGCKTMDYDKYAIYLEVAKHIGNILPEFPTYQCTLPKDIDSNYVFFQV
ncbi:putative cysteine desulfurase [Helianthus annuus]|uniref:Cysteine desulfurase n=1 Tax=Helianthus annuus TaxID=4232 RepID=A0A9K3DZL4_HELAN|nr:putative cysteine desulfurase [Helianthus annuus]KAJ0829994.1 putative cysteine desulfurase [Helianthus annuus]